MTLSNIAIKNWNINGIRNIENDEKKLYIYI